MGHRNTVELVLETVFFETSAPFVTRAGDAVKLASVPLVC